MVEQLGAPAAALARLVHVKVKDTARLYLRHASVAVFQGLSRNTDLERAVSNGVCITTLSCSYQVIEER
jgi:hypothetical protein